MSKKSNIFLIVFIAIFFGACSLKKGVEMQNNNQSLENTKWQLSSFNQKNIENSEKLASINFDKDNKVFGNLGCNNFFGTFKQKDNSLEIVQVGSTMMMCQNMSVEQNFSKVLQDVKSYKINDKNLIFFDDKNIEIAKFVEE